MKRFTQTEKWDDPWFWELSPTSKLLWLFICDHCDSSGVIELSLKLASTKIGQTIQPKHLDEIQSRLFTLENGKLMIRGFIRFQYGNLSRDCKPHVPIFANLSRHGVDLELLERISKGYAKAIDSLQEKEEEKDQEEEKEKDKTRSDSEKISTVAGTVPLPSVLNTVPFRYAWSQWIDHLKQKKKLPTLHAQDLQLRKLSEMGEPKAIQTLSNCIEKNWQGIYEDNSYGNTQTNQRNPTAGNRALTGAEQRQVGIPDRPKTITASEVIAYQTREREKRLAAEASERAAKKLMAAETVQP